MNLRSTVGEALQFLGDPLVLQALSVGALVLGSAAYGVAAFVGWRRIPAVCAGLGAALALSVTLSRETGWDGYVEPCSIGTIDLLTPLQGTQELLNTLLLMPFAFCAVLATRRPLPVLAVSVLMTIGIEHTQTLTGLGECTSDDLITNSLGATVAVGFAAVVNAWVADQRPVGMVGGSSEATVPIKGSHV